MKTVLMAVCLFVLSFVSLFIGVVDITLFDLFRSDSGVIQIFFASRLPRLFAILCTGTGMSVAGLIMQQLCMNKFISPTTGATISASQLGILFSLLFIPSSTLWSRVIFSFITAIAGTWIFIFFTMKIKFKDIVLVPLTGIMFGNIINGITSFIAYKTDMTQSLSSYLTGHFSSVIRGRYEIVYLVVPLVILAFNFSSHFNIVGMGKSFSKNLGVNYNLILFLGLTIASMITASIVSVVGSISYIGLIIPNVVSLFKGDNIKGTLLDVSLAGSLFVLVCDIMGRVVIAPFEVPIELIIGIFGSILFICLLMYRLKHGKKSVSAILNLTKKKEQ